MRTIRPEAMATHVKFLADDLLEGRGTGTRGYDLAAKYVAAHFEALGLEPGGGSGNFLSTGLFPKRHSWPEGTLLKLVSNGNEDTLVWGRDYFAAGDRLKSCHPYPGTLFMWARA